ncbi:MAG: hypothetical protein U0231_15890 [Nitrospiraceae bacterium]
MGIRMLLIGTAFSRFPRLVRDLAGKAGKKIQLVLGEETKNWTRPSLNRSAIR